MLAGTTWPPNGSRFSCFSHSSVSGPNNLSQQRQLFLQMLTTLRGDPIRLPAILGFNSSNPAAVLKTADRAISRARAEPNAREDLDIFHDCVAVFIPIG